MGLVQEGSDDGSGDGLDQCHHDCIESTECPVEDCIKCNDDCHDGDDDMGFLQVVAGNEGCHKACFDSDDCTGCGAFMCHAACVHDTGSDDGHYDGGSYDGGSYDGGSYDGGSDMGSEMGLVQEGSDDGSGDGLDQCHHDCIESTECPVEDCIKCNDDCHDGDDDMGFLQVVAGNEGCHKACFDSDDCTGCGAFMCHAACVHDTGSDDGHHDMGSDDGHHDMGSDMGSY